MFTLLHAKVNLLLWNILVILSDILSMTSVPLVGQFFNDRSKHILVLLSLD